MRMKPHPDSYPRVGQTLAGVHKNLTKLGFAVLVHVPDDEGRTSVADAVIRIPHHLGNPNMTREKLLRHMPKRDLPHSWWTTQEGHNRPTDDRAEPFA